ncbi:MAG: GtrA family protein, partial [Polyangiaceae bacterium]
ALRYGLVSGASLLLNMIGEWLVHDVAQVQYVFARAMVAASVSVLWNFPMQRNFVFKKGLKNKTA